MELMKSVLTEKDSSGNSIQNQLEETIERNAADVKKQIELFKSQTEIKKTEEKELLTVLKDYRKKYQEFERNLINHNFKTLEKEVKQLEQMNAKFLAEKNKFCKRVGFKSDKQAQKQIDEMQTEWDQLKIPINKEIEQLKAKCAELQLQIKQKAK